MESLKFLEFDVEIIRNPKRRRITLKMHPDKFLSVRADKKTKPREIIDFLSTNRTWIEKNIEKFRRLNNQFKLPKFEEGEFFPFLGELKYFKESGSKLKKIYFTIEDGFLICYLPQNKNISEFNDCELVGALKKYYRKEAELYLVRRVSYWAEITGLKPAQISFRQNQTRWGSCSSEKKISLNWKLICQSVPLIDYVIVHELCHLRHMNHSPEFWGLVENYYPEYKTMRSVLNDQERLGRFLDL